jgi:TRAP-type C4-dicarboxylate transport system permease small subunit
MNGYDLVAAGLLILALAPVELDPLLIVVSLVGLGFLAIAWVAWNAPQRRSSNALTYLAIGLSALGFALLVSPPLVALAALG